MSDRAIILLIVICSIVALAVAVPIVATSKSHATANAPSAAPKPQPPPAPQQQQQQQQPPVVPQVAKAGFFSRKTRIAGSIWITRNDGSSNLMRGLSVRLVNPTASAKAYKAALGRNMKEVRDESTRLQDEIKSFERDVGVGMTKEVASVYVKDVEELTAQAKAIKAAATAAPPTIDLTIAYQTLGSTSHFGLAHMEDLLTETTLQSVESDVDGKFEINGIPDGNYYLYASFSSRAMIVDWLVPIQASGGTLKSDLHNKNAILVRNIN